MELLPPDQVAFQRMLDVIRRNYERFVVRGVGQVRHPDLLAP